MFLLYSLLIQWKIESLDDASRDDWEIAYPYLMGQRPVVLKGRPRDYFFAINL